MDIVIWNELLHALKSFLMQPLLYWIIIFAYVQYRERVKLSVAQFRYQPPSIFYYIKHNLGFAFMMGFLISIFTVASGVSLTYELITILVILLFLFSFSYKYWLLSASFTLGLSYFIFILIMPKNNVAYFDITPQALTSLAFLVGLLLLAEAMLFLRLKNKDAFPILHQSKRGKWYVAYSYRTFTILPVFFFVPEGSITLTTNFWPYFSIGADSYSLLMFPFLIGLERKIHSEKPEKRTQQEGKRLILLSVLVLILSVVSLIVSELLPYVFLFAIIGRIVLFVSESWHEKKRPPLFVDDNRGIKIAHIFPHSPAERLGLQLGDTIVKVAGADVSTVQELDERIAKKAGLCAFTFVDEYGQEKTVENKYVIADRIQFGIVVATTPVKGEKFKRSG